jgi:hypothetical protein
MSGKVDGLIPLKDPVTPNISARDALLIKVLFIS